MEFINFVFTVLNTHTLSSSEILRFWQLICDIMEVPGAPDRLKKTVSLRDTVVESFDPFEVSCEII